MPPLIAALPYLAVAGTVAGAATSMVGAAQSKTAMNNTTLQQLATSQQLQKQATPIYEANLEKSSKPTADKAMASAEQAALAGYQREAARPQTTSAPAYMTTNGSKQSDARGSAEVARSQQANAALQQYPALESQWALGNKDTNNKLGTVNQMASIQQQNFPALLQLASQKGATTQGVGSLIGSLSQVAGVAGASMAKPSVGQNPTRWAGPTSQSYDYPTYNPVYGQYS